MPYKQVSIITKKWKNQKPPIGSQINWGHPLSKSLVGCYLFNEQGGRISKNLSSSFNSIHSLTTWEPNAISFPGGTSTANINAGLDARLHDLRPLTLIVKYNAVDGGGGNLGRFFQSSSAGGIRFAYFESAAATQINFQVLFPTNLRVLSSASFSVNTDIVLGIVWNGSTTASEVKIYKNLTEVGHATNSNGSGVLPTDAGGNFVLGNSTSAAGARCFKGKFYYFYIYNRALSPSEIQQLYQDPYCFIQPTRRRFYFQTGEAPAANKPTRRRVILSCN